MVKEITTRDELHSEFSNDANKGKLIVVDFHATWCGPCLRISPQLADWKNGEFQGRVVFLKVDVDKAENLSHDFKIDAMPTFVFFKNGNEVHRLVGADPILLKSDLEAFSSAPK